MRGGLAVRLVFVRLCSVSSVRRRCGGGVAAVWRTHDDGAVAALFVLFGCFLLCEGAGLAC